MTLQKLVSGYFMPTPNQIIQRMLFLFLLSCIDLICISLIEQQVADRRVQSATEVRCLSTALPFAHGLLKTVPLNSEVVHYQMMYNIFTGAYFLKMLDVEIPNWLLHTPATVSFLFCNDRKKLLPRELYELVVVFLR